MKKTIILSVLLGVLFFPSVSKAQEPVLAEQARQQLIADIQAKIQELLLELVAQLQVELRAQTNVVVEIETREYDEDTKTDSEETKKIERFRLISKADGEVDNKEYRLARIKIYGDKTDLDGTTFMPKVSWSVHHPGKTIDIDCDKLIRKGEYGYCNIFASNGSGKNSYTIKDISIKGTNGATYRYPELITGNVDER